MSETGIKIIATNNKARGDYFIEEAVEAGVVLQGTEVKSLRTQAPSFRDSFVDFQRTNQSLEAWLHNFHIPPYSHGNIWNHEANRPRKLLLHTHQIKKLFGAVTQQGLTVVPLKIYFKKGHVKIEIGLARGKKQIDKRETIKKRDAERSMARARRTRA